MCMSICKDWCDVTYCYEGIILLLMKAYVQLGMFMVLFYEIEIDDLLFNTKQLDVDLH